MLRRIIRDPNFIFCKQTNEAKYEIVFYKGDKEIDTISEEIRTKIVRKNVSRGVTIGGVL